MNSAIHRAISLGDCPPSVRVRSVIDSFIDSLVAARIGATFNFYRDGDRAELLRERLRRYLDERAAADIVLVGEAAGYRGARVSGLPFTSERQLTGSGPAEATATIVHDVLAQFGMAERILLWNAVPTHPHRVHDPDSNRPPSCREIRDSRCFIDALRENRRVIAVGRVAATATGAAYVRHPSHGGAKTFRDGLLHYLGAAA
jgi:hypothetical protein